MKYFSLKNKNAICLACLCAIASLSSCNDVPTHVVTYSFPEGVEGKSFEAKVAEGVTFTLPESVDSKYDHHTFTGWIDSNDKVFAPGDSVTMGFSDLNFVACFSLNQIAVDYCFKTTGSAMPKQVITPVTYYADNTWTAKYSSVFSSADLGGTWSLDASGLKMVNIDKLGAKTDLTVTDDGVYFMVDITASVSSFRGTSSFVMSNKISKYEMIHSYNKEFGTSFESPASEPVYKITYNSGNAAATGTDPVGGEYKRNESVVLKANPYALANNYFSGWNYNSTTYQPGDSIKVEMSDSVITPVWKKDIVLTSDAKDTFFKKSAFNEGVALTFYKDGTAKCNTYDGKWTLSAKNELTISNKDDAAVKIVTSADGKTFTYDIDTKEYYWGSAAANNMIDNHYTHTFTADAFVAAYNKTYSASISTVTVIAGTADFCA
jgi:hypothetical protein